MILKILLRIVFILMLAAPVALLFGMSAVVGNRTEVPPDQQSQWMSEHIWEITKLWWQSAILYAVGFWNAYHLWKPRSVALAWVALLCGILPVVCFPVGTLLTLPCLVTLFRKRMLWFWRKEPHAA